MFVHTCCLLFWQGARSSQLAGAACVLQPLPHLMARASSDSVRCAVACREAAAAQAEAAQQLVAASARSSRDAEKAAGVRAQQRLWGAALELRIRLQKALAGGNCLPRPHARAALAAASPQVAARWVAGG
jgi:hypothetical protein